MWNCKICVLIYYQASPRGNVKCHHVLQFLKLIDGTHNPNGQLSSVVPSAAFQKMNQIIHVTLESSNPKIKSIQMVIYVRTLIISKILCQYYMDRAAVLVFIHPACIFLIVMICAFMIKWAKHQCTWCWCSFSSLFQEVRSTC